MNLTTTTEESETVTVQSRSSFDELSAQINLDPRYDYLSSLDVAKSVFDLGNTITQQLFQTRNSKFEVISPLSIAAALNVVLLGSKGDTFNELLSALKYSKCRLYLMIYGERNLSTTHRPIILNFKNNKLTDSPE